MAGTPLRSQEFIWDTSSSFEDWRKQLNSDGWFLDPQVLPRETPKGEFVYTFFQMVPAQAHAQQPPDPTWTTDD